METDSSSYQSLLLLNTDQAPLPVWGSPMLLPILVSVLPQVTLRESRLDNSIVRRSRERILPVAVQASGNLAQQIAYT
jgi:hypothetical protein